MTDNEYRKTRKAAVDALIYWAKTGMRQFTMRDAVNNHLEASGANRPSIGGTEAILARRKIAANRLAIDCLYALSKDELSKVLKTEDIHPPKTGISVHFSGSLV